MRPTIYMCLIAIALSGCSSISRDLTFDGQEGNAFALVVADGMIVNGIESYRFRFQKVDIEKSEFLPESFSIYFSAVGVLQGDEFKKPAGLETPLRFAGKPIASGNYALISREDSAVTGTGQKTSVKCFALGALVFSIDSGSINALRVDSVSRAGSSILGDSAVGLQSKLVLAGYPSMSATVRVAPVVGAVNFEPTKGRFLAQAICGGGGVPVSFRPAQ
jgi:hypothetical protein